MLSTLIVNSNNEPLSIVPATRAVSLLVSGRAVSLDDSHLVFRSSGHQVAIPYVIKLKDSTIPRRAPLHKGYSARGVFVRDNFTCVYCKGPATTIDHVVPQSKGGPSTYENCVACCQDCNSKKADRHLDEMGWKISHDTTAPSWYLMALSRSSVGTRQHQAWLKYMHSFDPQITLRHTMRESMAMV